MLMQRMDGDTIHACPRSLGQRFAPGVVPAVGDANPVDRAQDNGFVFGEDDDATRAQRVGDRASRRVRHGTADWRRSVDVERADREGLGFGTPRAATQQRASRKNKQIDIGITYGQQKPSHRAVSTRCPRAAKSSLYDHRTCDAPRSFLGG